MSTKVRSLLPHIVAVLIFILTCVAYFFPQIEGKVVRQGDISQFKAMSQEVRHYQEIDDEPILWTNSMFGGIPTYQLTRPESANALTYISNFLNLGFSRPIGYFIMGLLVFYLMFLSLKISPLLSAIGALMAIFSTNNVILFEAGHTSKILTIFTMGFIVAGVIITFEKKYLLGLGLMVLGLGLNILHNHPQMTYYLAMFLGILALISLVSILIKKDYTHALKSVSVFLLSIVLALGANATKLLTTIEYAEDTMRGKSILKSEDSNSSSNVDGLAFDYAMQWSNNSIDVLASFIPHVAGGGSGEWLSPKSDLAKKLNQRRKFKAPTYWGGLPLTSGPIYLGAIALFLFIYGCFIIKGRYKWWLLSSLLLSFLLSMGKNAAFLNEFLFEYLPYFNKFRTPNSVLSVTTILIPILSIFAIDKVVSASKKEKDNLVRPLWYSLGIYGGLCLIVYLFGSSLFSFSHGAGDAQYSNFIDDLVDQRISLMKSSTLRTLLFVSLISGLIYLYLKDKFKKVTFILSIGIIALIDIMGINLKYLNSSNFERKAQLENQYQPRAVDQQILQDTDPYYRVYDSTINTFNSASSSYHHKTIGGYHPAKLQRYQDIIDHHISKSNQSVLNMLNTKYYIVADQNGTPTAQANSAALGNAWFVENVKFVTTANEEISNLTGLNPAITAIVHQDFNQSISHGPWPKGGSISLTEYHPNRLKYSSSNSNAGLVVFSDIWYGPDKGWNAYIDGSLVQHIRVNYVLRGLQVPAGDHEIIFKFEPTSFATGEKISLASSLLIILIMSGLIYLLYKNHDVFKSSDTQNNQ